MNKTLIDNSANLKMVNVLKECISTPEMNTIRIATGYWDIPGMALVIDELSAFLNREGTKLKLLIGKDPYVYGKMLNEPKFRGKEYPGEFIRTNINDLADNLKPEYKQVIDLLLKCCDNGAIKKHSSRYAITEIDTHPLQNEEVDLFAQVLNDKQEDTKIEIRILEKGENEEAQFLHSKCYIFTSESKKSLAYGIIGSSNFTQKGLEGNAELNYLEDTAQIVRYGVEDDLKGHVGWFEEKWENAEDWTQEFLEQILLPSKPVEKMKKEKEEAQTTSLTPYELYIKYLQMHFGDIADASTRAILDSYLPHGYKSINYQMDAVEQCFQIMRTYGGFFLSDVVGLGKTIVGLLIIKKFIAEAANFNREPKVLIIVPPAIRPAWEDAIKKFDKESMFKIADSIKIVNTGSIGSIYEEDFLENEDDDIEEDFGLDNYGMIIIDESHNFRNNETRKYKLLQGLIGRITMAGEQPFIGLLSATPQNNSPEDLKNQIYLFELEPNNSRFDVEGRKLDSFFSNKEMLFKRYRNDDSEEARIELKKLSKEIREEVLDHIVVRRTRTDIKKRYPEDAQNLKFPTIKGPKKLEYKMDAQLVKLFADTMTAILPPEINGANGDSIGYYRYQAINYFSDPKNKKLYEKRNLTVEGISRRLSKLMQILLVKRLESSFSAFTESLENLLQYTRNMIMMIEHNQVFVCPDVDINKIFSDNDYDFEKSALVITDRMNKKGGNNRCFLASDFCPEYMELLKRDESMISELCLRWKKNKFDPKLMAFSSELNNQLFDPIINNPSKHDKPRLVIFTEAKATQDEIKRIAENTNHKVLKINASNRTPDNEKKIKENFDALSEVKVDDYDIIVTTEVLAEGVNLHRSNVILNYDTPWNATRLMQRIGRVNRIGSKEDFVHVFNFYPSVEGNEYIKLIQKAYAKLQAFHIMFGEDNKVYSELEELSEADFNHDFDGEESPFSQFFADLKHYKADHPERYEYIKNLDVDNLGGQYENGDGLHRFVIKTKKRAGTPIIVDATGEAKTVSPLGFMQSLKEASFCAFTQIVDDDLYKLTTDKAIQAFNEHLTHVINANDSNKEIDNAKEKIKQIWAKLTTNEAKKALKNAKKAVENGNSLVIRLVNTLAEEYLNPSEIAMFDEIDNVEVAVQSMFTHIADKAKQKAGEPYIGLYAI